MAKIKCEKCGHEIEINEAQLSTYQESVDKAVKAKEDEIRKNVENEFTAKSNEEIKKLEKKLNEAERSLKDLEAKQEINLAKVLSEKDKRITKLEADLKVIETNNKANINDAINDKDKKILELQNELKLKDNEKVLEIKSLEEKYKFQIREKEDFIKKIKEYKDQLTVKALGEELEQHCLSEFNKIRINTFPNCEFHKDNEVSDESHSKGDFIFRDFVDGQEYISIMFDMKNEKDQTKTKHKNADFFKELDKDRKEKKCEYAVLVSELEPNSEFYNTGIADVSFEYPKMFVVRPQYFITIITLLTNAAKSTVSARKELEVYKKQNIGIVDFENKLMNAKNDLKLSLDRAGTNFQKAIDDIDKSIKNLQEMKNHLLKTIEGFHTAENKMEGITIRKLTYGNPVMQEKFSEIKKEKKNEEKDD